MVEESITEEDIDIEERSLHKTLDKCRLSLIIPAYNEEHRIGPFLQSLIRCTEKSVEIIIVCDGDDKTAEIARSYGHRVQTLEFQNRLGKGRAILEGFKIATGDVVGFVDADGAVEPKEIGRLASLVSEATPVVIGSRWVNGSEVVVQEPLMNRLAGRVFHYLTFLILGIRSKDTQCGLKFIHRSVVNAIIPKIRVVDWMIDVAILYHIKLLGKPIKEIGITWTHKSGSKFPLLKAIPIMFTTLIAIRIIHSGLFIAKFSSLTRIADQFTAT